MTSLMGGSEYIRDVRLGTTQAAAVYLGTKKIWPPMDPVATQYTTVGSFTYTIPADCDKIDVVLIGGGGGGGNGSFWLPGTGGGAGQWSVTTLVRGVDIPWSTTSLTGSVGAGGAGGSASGAANNGQPGGATTISSLSLSAAGGEGGAGWGNGQRNGFTPSPSSQTLNGQTYVAGTGDANEGNPPGAGGASVQGTVFGNVAGFAGARGQAWFYAHSASPNPLPSTPPGEVSSVSYDSTGTGGVGSGSTSTFTVTGTHTCNGNAVVVALSPIALGVAITSCTVTYGGQAMTHLGTVLANNLSYVPIYLFGLLDPPTGSQTISGTATSQYMVGLNMTSVSYSGVTSFGTVTTAMGSSTTPAQTVSSTSGNMMAHVFGMGSGATVSAYSQTQRLAQVGSYSSLMQGDAAGAASISFSGTLSASSVWGSIAVELIA